MLTQAEWLKITDDQSKLTWQQMYLIIAQLHQDAIELVDITKGMDDFAHAFYKGELATLKNVMQLFDHLEVQK